MIKSYIKYRRRAVNAHGIHSPFVYEFYQKVVRKRNHTQYPEIESLRKSLLKDTTSIEVEDFGAGSRKNKSNQRKIKSITKNAAISKKYGQLLTRIVSYYKIENILELGTSMGIGTAYLASGNPNGLVRTIEGCATIAQRANENLNKLAIANYELMVGEFSSHLSVDQKTYDLIYIDGNHQYQPTIDYFKFALEHSHDETVIIFDDIYWSEEMERAWANIKKDRSINVSIDLFQIGIICKRVGQRKEHFILKF